MGMFANFIPTLKITQQLSFSSNVLRYTSLVQVLQCHHYSKNSLTRNLTLQRFYSADKYDKPTKRFITAVHNDKFKANSMQKSKSMENTSSILPIALIHLNPLSVNSSKVLLIPLNWQNADEVLMRNTITSIFSKRKNLQQIEAFSEALQEISIGKTGNHNNVQGKERINNLKNSFKTVEQQKEFKLERYQKSKKISEKLKDRQKIFQNDEASNSLQNLQENEKLKYCFKNSQNNQIEDEVEEEPTEIPVPTRYALDDSKNSSLVPLNGSNIDYLDHLAAAVEKALRQCCLESIQMSVDSNIFGEIITGLKFYPTITEFGAKNISDLASNNTINDDPLRMASIMKIDTTKLNLEDIECHKKNPFADIQSSSLTNITFPTNVIRKSFSTRTNTMQQKLKSPSISRIRENESTDSSMLSILPKRSSHSDNKMAPNSKNSSSKCKANYNLPSLSKVFGAEKLLMSCDAYNKALIEAVRKKEALVRGSAQLKKSKGNDAANRHQVISIKGCSEPTSKKNSKHAVTKSSKPCPPSIKQASKGECKKDEPCKPPQCPNPCKDEMEKLKRTQDEDAKSKRNEIPTGCLSPKCKKDDSCSKLKKNPCKKASDHKSAAQVNSTMKQAKDDTVCPNSCKNEMEKLKRQKDEEAKRKKGEMPTGCMSPKCKKDERKSPSKKSSETIGSSRPPQKSSTYPMVFAKGKGKDKNNPCSDEHTEYRPKCNKDPCKKDSEPHGDNSSKPTKTKPDHCKTNKSKKGDQNKKEPCKQKSTYSNESKKEDSCNKGQKKEKNKDDCGGSINKEDPFKKEEKKDPCGRSKPKEDSCKKGPKKEEKKDHCGVNIKKEDPCKKNEKNDPCVRSKSKEEESKKKEKKDSSGGSKQKEDTCQKKEKKDSCAGSNKKQDSCKKKNSRPCGSNRKGKSSPCFSKKKEDLYKQKKQSEAGYSKQKENSCIKKKSSPCISQNKNVDSCKKEDLCKKKVSSSPSPCKKSKEKYKSQCNKSSSSSSLGSTKSDLKRPCGKPKRETKPNCSNNKKWFSTLAVNGIKPSNPNIKPTCTSLRALPILRNKNINSFGFMQHFSSKGGKSNKKDKDHGKQSKCKSMAAVIPPKRTPAYNPHPKDGLRKCYPTYDMDCRKICKEPRQTACNRYSFLKDTENNKRNGRK